MRFPALVSALLGLLSCRHGFDVASYDASTIEEIDASSQDAWWNDDWSERRRLRFDNSAQTEDLLDVPVLVTLDASITSLCQEGGRDLRFVDNDGALLAHEVDDWESGLVWVRVPTIDGGSSEDGIWLYFGNGAAPDGSSNAEVWNAEYLGVWHLSGDPRPAGGGEVSDSTANAHVGSSQGDMTSGDLVVAQIGKGLDFDGSDDYLSSALQSSVFTDFTFTAWFEARDAGAIPDNLLAQRLVSQKRNQANSRAALGVNRDRIASYWWNGDHNVAEGTTVLESGRFYFAALRLEGDSFTLYLDGEAETSWQEPNLIAPSAHDVRIAHQSLSEGRYWNGRIDEVRVSNVARSSDWIRAQYLIQSGDFVTIE